MHETPWDTLSRAMAELRALEGAANLLQWDQETFMPPGGAEARGDQRAAIEGLRHERLTGPALAHALDRAEAEAAGDADRRAALRWLRWERDRALQVPADLVRAIAQAQSAGVEAWNAARAAADFGRFAPSLERLLALRREQAAALLPVIRGESGDGVAVEPYDALLDASEPGMRVARLEPIFARLVAWQAPLAARVAARPPPDDAFLRGRFDPEAQRLFSLELLEAMGFDLRAGRLDASAHPFCQGIDPGDVRLTTRIHEALPLSAIFSALHEGGHGLYEQNLPAALRRSVVCAPASMGLHESQSRLWENHVGRGLPFWRAFLPRAARRFPQLAGVGPEAFFRAVNKVERTLVRVEADELTYDLHVALRFELELALFRGELAARDLPAAWDARYERFLGLRPRDDREGVLQDIHWAWGLFGYFPTYTIGNLYAASLHAAARRALPGLDEAIARGDLGPLRGWLVEHVHRVGRRRDAEEIVRAATGAGLTDRDFEAYLRAKYDAPRA